MFPEHRRLFEAVGQDARHAPARIQRPAHRSPIDAPGAARYQAALRRCGESPHVLGVLNQRLVHVPGADDRQAAGAQDRGLATAVEYRGSVLSKALLQAARVIGIRPAQDPDRPRLPAFHRLGEEKPAAEQQASRVIGIRPAQDPDRPRPPAFHRLGEEKPAAEQPFESFGIQLDPALAHDLARPGIQQIGGLAPQLTEPAGKLAVLAGGEQFDGRLASSGNQRRGQQQDRLRVGRQLERHQS